jgi:hypothetical protein
MSMTEFVKYEQEIIKLKDEVIGLKAKLEEANEVIKYYADDENWDCDKKAYHDHIIDESDMEPKQDGIGKVGGWLARTHLTTKTQGE